MTRDVGAQSSLGSHSLSEDWESVSRPSKTNCTSGSQGGEAGETRSSRRTYWRRKNELVNQLIDQMPARAQRPISVREGTSVREETVSEKYGQTGLRAKSWSESLRAFLTWYNEYRSAHRVFRSPEGEIVRAPLTNSHQPNYGDRYYARIKALERQITADYEDLYVAMLTLSGSSRNGDGGWRCPADHLRDVINSFRPKEGRGVYHALYDALRGYQWEYALVVEHHKTGYGHVHVAVFIDGKVEESDFHSAIDSHLRTCEIAHRDAHDYYSTDESNRPISVRQVDSNLDPEDYDENEEVGNLGSYIGEYIGSYGEELFDRNVEELIFRASCWATGTQMVRFSTGANALIDRELDDAEDNSEPIVIPNPEFDSEVDASNDTNTKPFEVVDAGWSLEGIARVDEEGETVFDLQRKGVQYQEIDGAEHLDPPNPQPSGRPTKRTLAASLEDYNPSGKL